MNLHRLLGCPSCAELAELRDRNVVLGVQALTWRKRANEAQVALAVEQALHEATRAECERLRDMIDGPTTW